MNRGVILYQSKYGATEQYAKWLAETCGYDLFAVKKAKIGIVANYPNIVFTGAVYASGISGLPFLKKHARRLEHRNVAVFCVGASPYDEKFLRAIKERNLKGGLENVPLFYGRGAWNESKMKWVDRMLCKMLQKAVAKKDPATYEPWEAALMSAVGKSCDWTDRAYLTPLIDLIHKWQGDPTDV